MDSVAIMLMNVDVVPCKACHQRQGQKHSHIFVLMFGFPYKAHAKHNHGQKLPKPSSFHADLNVGGNNKADSG